MNNTGCLFCYLLYSILSFYFNTYLFIHSFYPFIFSRIKCFYLQLPRLKFFTCFHCISFIFPLLSISLIPYLPPSFILSFATKRIHNCSLQRERTECQWGELLLHTEDSSYRKTLLKVSS